MNPRARAALVFLLACLVLYSRTPDRLAHGFLWAEDSREFIAYAHRLGKYSLLMDYAGYLHVLPRLLAYAQFMLTPIWAAPYVMVVSCFFITAGTCAYIAAAIRPPLLAIAMGISPVLMPQQGEVFLSIANLQWIMFPLLVVLLWELLFDPPKHIWPRVIVTAVLAMTGPFSLILWPFAFALVLQRRLLLSRAQFVWFAVFTAAMLVQAWTMYKHPAFTPSPGRVDWLHRAPRELFAELLPGNTPLWTGYVAALWLIVLIVGSRTKLISAFICIVSIVLWALAAYRVNGYTPNFSWDGAGSRYVYISMLMFTWTALLAVSTARHRVIAWSGVVFAGMIVVTMTTQFRMCVWQQKWEIVETPTTYELTVPPNWTTTILR